MQLGLSSYSLSNEMKKGEMTIKDAIKWIADNGGQHIEVVDYGLDLIAQNHWPDEIKALTTELGIAVSNYAISANIADKSELEIKQEIDRIKLHIDIAHRMGAKLLRHDVAFRPIEQSTLKQYMSDLSLNVEVCQEIADYAAQYGIVTSIENHGYFIQGSDRVTTLIDKVNRSNFKLTLDIGNFMCSDENSVDAVRKTLPYASIIHLKDFYYRPSYHNPGEGWFPTANGNYLRGAILGHGDINLQEIIRMIKQSGYDGYFSVEFEGLEECKWASRVSMDNAFRIWNEN